MSWIILIPFLALGIFLLLLLLLVQRLRETVAGRIFAAILFSLAAWSFCSWMMHVGASPSPYFWLVTGFVFVIAVSPLLVHFAMEYPCRKPGIKWLIISWYGMALVFEVGNLLGKFVERVTFIPASGGVVDIEFGSMMYIGWPYMALSILLVAVVFTHSYRSTNSRAERLLLRYPLVGTMILFSGGLLNAFPGLSGYPIDLLANIAFALVVAYAISRHQFLNIRLLFRRNLSDIVLVLTLSALFVFVLRQVQEHVSEASGFYLWLMMAPLFAAFTVVFYAMRGYLQSRIDRLFFGEQYDYRKTLLEFSQKMGSTLKLDRLAGDLLRVLCRSLNCDRASLVLPSPRGDYFEVRSSTGLGDEFLPGDIQIPNDDTFVILAGRHGRPLSRAEIEIMAGPGNAPISDDSWVNAFGCDLICPLLTGGNMVGFIVLGRKRSGEQYSDEDLLLMSTVSNQAAVAIDNARLYDESKKAYTELQRMQQDLIRSERMHTLGQMASGVAHDFNNILTAILTRTELALDKVGVSKAKKDLEVIQLAALDGAQVTKRIQEFAKLRQVLEPVPVDVNMIVESALMVVEHLIVELQQTKGVFLDITRDLRSVNRVLGNVADLRQVLVNIMMNAIEAMPSGGEINLVTEDREGWVCMAVSDTGIGMSPGIKEKIFELMFTTNEQGGSGLGLAVAETIIHRYKGRIEVDSELGEGSTFCILLPSLTSFAQTPSVTRETYQNERKGNILIIDDDEEVLESLRLTLTKLGHNTTCATNGPDGLAHVQQMRFDLVITDLGMPSMSGGEVAMYLEDIRPHIPVLLITVWGIHIDSEQMEELKVQGILPKPFTRAEVTEAVNKLLE